MRGQVRQRGLCACVCVCVCVWGGGVGGWVGGNVRRVCVRASVRRVWNCALVCVVGVFRCVCVCTLCVLLSPTGSPPLHSAPDSNQFLMSGLTRLNGTCPASGD